MTLSRREFVQVAAAMGASLAWGGRASASRIDWREARALPLHASEAPIAAAV